MYVRMHRTILLVCFFCQFWYSTCLIVINTCRTVFILQKFITFWNLHNIQPYLHKIQAKKEILYWMTLNMAYSLLPLLKIKLFFVQWDRFGNIDHNGASRVSKFTEKTDKQYYLMLPCIRLIVWNLRGHLCMLRDFFGDMGMLNIWSIYGLVD